MATDITNVNQLKVCTVLSPGFIYKADDNGLPTNSIIEETADNIGVGTGSPSARLAVNGGIHVGGDSDPGDNNLSVDGMIGVGIIPSDYAVDVRSPSDTVVHIQPTNGNTNSASVELSAASSLVIGNENATGSSLLTGSIAGAGIINTPNAYPIQIGTASTVRATIDENGNVGIGTTTPSARLAVNGGLHVGGDSNPGDNNLVVDGLVGIGTNTPAAQLAINGGLHVGGDSDPGDNNVIIDGRLGVGTTPSTYSVEVVGAANTSIRVASPDGSSYNAATRMTAYDSLIVGNENSIGATLASNSLPGAGVVNVSGAHPLQLGTNNTVRATISAAGRVGIGTATPGSELDIVASAPIINLTASTPTQSTNFQCNNGSGGMCIGVENSSGSSIILGASPYAVSVAQTSAQPLQFGTNNAVRMTIASNGYVGFGTTIPSGVFDIQKEISNGSQGISRAVSTDHTYDDLTNKLKTFCGRVSMPYLDSRSLFPQYGTSFGYHKAWTGVIRLHYVLHNPTGTSYEGYAVIRCYPSFTGTNQVQQLAIIESAGLVSLTYNNSGHINVWVDQQPDASHSGSIYVQHSIYSDMLNLSLWYECTGQVL